MTQTADSASDVLLVTISLIKICVEIALLLKMAASIHKTTPSTNLSSLTVPSASLASSSTLIITSAMPSTAKTIIHSLGIA